MLKPAIANVTGITIVLALLAGCATIDTGSSSGSNYASMPAENILGLLNHPEDIRKSFNGQERDALKACYRGVADECPARASYDLAHASRTEVAEGPHPFVGTDPAAGLKALMLGCSYDAQPNQGLRRHCADLAFQLYWLGNIEGARGVLLHAPGCHSFTVAGDPQDRCFDQFIFLNPIQGGKSFLTTEETIDLARGALLYASSDVQAAQYLSSHGVSVDISAAQEAYREAKDNSRVAAHEHNAATAAAQAASDSRRDALIGALQSAPGAGDPNAILNAGAQQAAALRAIGDANAVRQQQDTLLHMASQRSPQQTTSKATKIVDGTPSAPQGNAQVVTSSTGAPSNVSNSNIAVGLSTLQYSTPLATSCVRQFLDPKVYNWLSFENNCGQAIYVTIIFHRPGGWAMTEGMHLASGNHNNTGLSGSEVNQAGGFDIYVCPTDSVPVDLSGNVLNANVAEYRCKPQ